MNVNEMKTLADLYPDRWIKPEHLQGHEVVVKIIGARVEEFHQRDNTLKAGVVLSFERAQRKLILNKTQASSLVLILGSAAFADWVGRTICLAPSTAQNGKPTIAVLAAETVGIAKEEHA